MANSNLLYHNYLILFQEGKLDFKRPKISSDINEINEVTSICVERIENDIWLPKSEFEFALLMLRYNIDFKNNLPAAAHFPSYVQITTHNDMTEAFILETIIAEVGGLDEAENIIQKKQRQAVGYTAFLHGYRGYIFNSSEWRKPELLKPYDARSKYVPMNVLRNAVRLISRSKPTQTKVIWPNV